MIIDRTHAGWAGFVAAGTVLSTLAYLANYHPDALPFHIPLPDWAGPVPPVRANVGGTPLGLFFGTLALLIFLFAALLGFRRRRPSLPIGRMQTWLKAHIWFTIFTIPLVLFHSGFTGGGPMTQLLLVLYAIVMASGFYGLALQRFLPSIMRRYLQEEVIYEQIPFVSAQLHMQALAIREELATPPVTVAAQEHAMVAGHGDHAEGTDAPAPVIVNTPVTPASVVSFVDSNVIPFVSVDAWMWQYQDTFKAEARHKEREAGGIYYARAYKEYFEQKSLGGGKRLSSKYSRLGRQREADELFRLVKLQTPLNFAGLIDKLREICDQRRGLNVQLSLQHWLHMWILVHAPVSFLLIILTCWHAVVATFVY